MIVRFLVAATVSFLLTALGHFYIYVRLIEPFYTEPSYFWAALFLFLWALTFFGFPLARAVPVAVRKILEMAMFVWMGSAYILLLLCVLTSPVSLALQYFSTSEKPLSAGLIALSLLLVMLSLRRALGPATVISTEIELRGGLGEDLSDVRVVLISDVHVAGLIGRRRMKQLAAQVNALKPHLVFVIGDLVDGYVGQLKNEVLPLKELNPTHGVYYVTGNHEYYCNAPKWRAYCADVLGWRVLSNEHCIVHVGQTQFNIIGIEDRSSLHQKNGKRSADHRLTKAVAGISAKDRTVGCNVLLAHQPKDSKCLKQAPWIDLQVSGHTHGGQLWPLKIFVLSDQKYNIGKYILENGTRLYVSQGTGFWGPPMRLGTQCEISLLTLKSPKII